MAVTTSKVTYSLKPATVDRVQELSRAWGVAKSEVIRRLVDQASLLDSNRNEVLTPLQALDRMGRNSIPDAVADRYIAEIRRERKAAGRRKK